MREKERQTGKCKLSNPIFCSDVPFTAGTKVNEGESDISMPNKT